MINLTGKLYNVVTNPFTDRETGQITQVSQAEILHTVKGKTELVSVKIDPVCVEGWTKAVGRDIVIEVAFYAMKTTQGAIQKGLMLAAKTALPGVLRAPVAAA